MGKNYFTFDKNKCVACEACVVGCMNENGYQEFQKWRTVYSSNENKYPGLSLFYISMSCNHCEEALCMDNCPALAYSRSIISGAIIHDADKCIGCQYCTWNCPYDAPKYNPIKGVIEKCNFCESRIIKSEKPACANACPTGALDFSFEQIDKNLEQKSFNVPIKTNPSILIKELENIKSPQIDITLFEAIDAGEKGDKKLRRISAKKEWPLLIFTIILGIMVAFSASDYFIKPSNNFKIIYFGIGIFGGLLSFFHLGNKKNAWRAVLNIKKSWLSREIFFFIFFLGAVFIKFFVFEINNYMVVLIGFMLLFSIDRLYKPVQWHWTNRIYSNQLLLSSLSIYLLLNSFIYPFIILVFIRIFLFLIIKTEYLKMSVKILRAIFLLSSIVLFFTNFLWLCFIIFIIGEIIERIVFYENLKLPELKNFM